MYATDFLHRLSLDQDADERAIKRAYARELKLIDQEADAAGFQVLRHAYEMALYWVKHGADRATAAQAHVAPHERAAGHFYVPPGTRKVDPLLLAQPMSQPPRLPVSSQAAPRGRIPNELERKAMFKRVDYFGPHTAPGKYEAEFLIDLDERGAIRKLVKKSASGLPVLDAQIEEAIRAAAPFGAQISRSFTVRHGQRYLRHPRPAAPESAPPAPE